ncbi:hypothetical protein P9112_008342 [Eukaryota sp. TZLM1-RC]
MFESLTYTGSLPEQYEQLHIQLDTMLTGESDRIAHLSNASALLNHFLQNVNWVGFYILKHDVLILGPFQGLPACVRIPKATGVCGTAVADRSVQRIADVHVFPGHIACDSASNSEIVVPIFLDGEIYGVLDIDSPIYGRFSEEDERGLVAFIDILAKHLKYSS